MKKTKLIREARFGPPKTWKTGAVVTTYPRPLLCLQFDNDGLSVVPDKIRFLTVEELAEECKKPTADLAPITAVDFSKFSDCQLTDTYVPIADAEPFRNTIKAINLLKANCPFETVVLDNITSLSDLIWMHQAKTNPGVISDPRKWAGNIGMKVKQIIGFIHSFDCHSVCIMHSELEKNDDTKAIREMPYVHSKVREIMGGLFSQFFYTENVNGKPRLRTTNTGFVTTNGVRWPANLAPSIAPTFNDIYKGVNFNE